MHDLICMIESPCHVSTLLLGVFPLPFRFFFLMYSPCALTVVIFLLLVSWSPLISTCVTKELFTLGFLNSYFVYT